MENMKEKSVGLSSILFISFHSSIWDSPYFPYLFTIPLGFLPYIPYHFAFQLTFLDMENMEERSVEM
jgi:hypothetical protein